jgi:hypothetical protein
VKRVLFSRYQRGYLYEIPVVLLAILLAMTLLFPHLSPGWQKILLAIAVLPTLYCVYYVIVRRGWTPAGTHTRHEHRRLGVWLICAIAVLAGVAAFWLRQY